MLPKTDLTMCFSMGSFSTVNNRSPEITLTLHPKHIHVRLAILIRNLTGTVWPPLEFQVSIVHEVLACQTGGGVQHFVDDVDTDAYRNTRPRVNPNAPVTPSFCPLKHIVWPNPSGFFLDACYRRLYTRFTDGTRSVRLFVSTEKILITRRNNQQQQQQRWRLYDYVVLCRMS